MVTHDVVHRLKSGKMLKEMRGHTSYVNDATYTSDGSKVVSCSSDGTVRVWDVKSSECSATFRTPQPVTSSEIAIICISSFPKSSEQLVVCGRCNTVYLMTTQGHIVKSFSSGKRAGGSFVACQVSPKGDWIYCLGEDGNIYCFSTATNQLESLIKAHDVGPIGICHHPHRNILATFSSEGILRIWKP